MPTARQRQETVVITGAMLVAGTALAFNLRRGYRRAEEDVAA